ncbi:hypothetical protein I3A88_16850 [Salmonella enterica]|nr:hypothetical protein [Salmonella enterica subsp. enterica serovar Lagos]MBH0741965.1 hypothetical protein [Salmonella enterica]
MAKLTKKEQAWIDEVNAVLARCPSPEKIGFFTIGDPVIGLYDLRHDKEIADTNDDLIPVAQRNGWLFEESLYFPSAVNGLCG